MSQVFVTPEELEIALRSYAKSSDLDSSIRETDASLRVFIERTIQIANRELLTKVALDLNAAKTDHQKSLHTQIGAAKESTLRELEVTLASLKDGVSHYLLNQAMQAIDRKSDENRREYLGFAGKAQEQINQTIKSHDDDSLKRVEAALSSAEAVARKTADEVARSHVESVQKQTVAAVENALSEIAQHQAKKFEEFKTVLDYELSQKVIEKAQIERKIQEIEVELRAKTQSVIEFQLEQARVMMEQSARSEVRDGIQASLQMLMK